MIRMNVFQSADEWRTDRRLHIGGSDAAAVIGMNPWKTNIRLWEEKSGLVEAEDISDKECVIFGVRAEPLIREITRLNYPQYDFSYAENNSWVNDDRPWMAASLDGWMTDRESGMQGIHEIKTSEITSSSAKEKWNDKIPQNYYCQLLHYLGVRTDCDFAILTALLTWKAEGREPYQQIRNYRLDRADVRQDIEYLVEKEEEFWECVRTGKRPALILPEF